MARHTRKKIVFLIGTLNVGGSQFQIIETAARLNREVFDPKLYCLFGGGALEPLVKERDLEATIFDPNAHNNYNSNHLTFKRSRQFLALYRYLRRQQPDILHGYMYKPCIYGGFAAKLAGIPVLLTSRRCLGFFKDEKPYYQTLENLVNRFTDGVLVNAHAVKHDVLQRERIAPDKIYVMHNGIDINTYKPTNHDTEAFVGLKKRAWGIPDAAPVVGMLANLFPYKGYREFLLAAAEVHRHHPEVRFLCVGKDCGLQKELEQLSKTTGLQQHVIFTGEIHNIPDLLHVLDIQVSTSYEEGFSNAILEGMASGKPIVATSVGGTPEAVVHNVTGLLVPPKDPNALAQAIMVLLDQPEFAQSLGMNGRKRVEERFTIEIMMEHLEAWYLRLCEKKGI